MSRKALPIKQTKHAGSPKSAVPARSSFSRIIKVAAGALVVFPWIALVIMLGKGSLFKGSHDAYKDLPGGKKCIGWRETYFCNPFA